MGQEPDMLLTILWKKHRKQGYPGAYNTLSEALKYHGIRIGNKAGTTKKLPTRAGATFKPSTTAIWFVSEQANLGDAKRKIVEDLCATSKDLEKAFSLAQSFRNMMAKRSGNIELRDWIMKSKRSGIPEMASFAKGLLTDYAAIENALTLSWSNGPVEGQITRLKLLKRQGYGRAGSRSSGETRASATACSGARAARSRTRTRPSLSRRR